MFAHEYGHVLYHDLSVSATTRMLELHKAALPKVRGVSAYAETSVDEWVSEVFATVTAPGYTPGALSYEQDPIGILAADGKMVARLAPGEAAFPPLTALDEVQIGDKAFAGQSTKALMRDAEGAEYLVKQPQYGGVDIDGRLEESVTQLAERLGITHNRVAVMDDGRTIQRVLPEARSMQGVPATELTDQEWLDLADHWVFDHAVGNPDAHAGQFVLREGRVIGVDKDMSMVGLIDLDGWDEPLRTHAFMDMLGELSPSRLRGSSTTWSRRRTWTASSPASRPSGRTAGMSCGSRTSAA